MREVGRLREEFVALELPCGIGVVEQKAHRVLPMHLPGVAECWVNEICGRLLDPTRLGRDSDWRDGSWG